MAIKIVVSNVCPAATILDSDGTTSFSVASGGNGTCTPVAAKSGIAYSRNYHSGQLTSLALYDDAWQYNNGSYAATTPSNPLYIQQVDWAADSTGWTLKYNNAFGNLNRFTNSSGGAPVETTATNYSIDNFTGLGHVWTNSGSVSSDFAFFYGASGLLQFANQPAVALNGYTDWFSLNAKMATNLVKYDSIKQNVPFFRNNQTNLYTSTSYNSTQSYEWNSNFSIFYNGAKTTSRPHVFTRIHFK